MVFVTAAIAIGVTIVGILSATGLTSYLVCGDRKSLREQGCNISRSANMLHAPFVHPNDPYYFTEPIVRSETVPFLNKEARKRLGYDVDPKA